MESRDFKKKAKN